MSFLNVEIKATCSDTGRIREYLVNHHADFIGTDEQTDTYFNVSNGRLKLREGNIENNLIFYERPDQAGPKDSKFHLIKIEKSNPLKDVLELSVGVKVVVKKRRDIFYLDNVKFHIDEVENLGSFIEIEAGNITSAFPQNKLKEQCEYYMLQFGISPDQLIEVSYSDMLLQKING
jgi:predicted adenylyl cyclase CyaB